MTCGIGGGCDVFVDTDHLVAFSRDQCATFETEVADVLAIEAEAAFVSPEILAVLLCQLVQSSMALEFRRATTATVGGDFRKDSSGE